MIPPLMMCKQMLINDIKNKFTELAPNKEVSYNTTASKKVSLNFKFFSQVHFSCRNVYRHLDLTYSL